MYYKPSDKRYAPDISQSIFLQITHEGHPLLARQARHWCLLWDSSLIEVLNSNLQCGIVLCDTTIYRESIVLHFICHKYIQNVYLFSYPRSFYESPFYYHVRALIPLAPVSNTVPTTKLHYEQFTAAVWLFVETLHWSLTSVKQPLTQLFQTVHSFTWLLRLKRPMVRGLSDIIAYSYVIYIYYLCVDQFDWSQSVFDWWVMAEWVSYQIRKIVYCACTGNAGNVFPATDFKINH